MMNRLVYQRLSRELLWLLLESRSLRPAAYDRLVAYQVFYFPPALLLELPDEERFLALLNPMTREEHGKALAQALLHLVSVEERDSWVLTEPRLELVIRHAENAKTTVLPLEDSAVERAAKEELRFAQELRDKQTRRALLHAKLEVEDAEGTYLKQGDGVLALSRGRRLPRITLFERMNSSFELAWMVADCALTLRSSAGSRRYPAHALIPISHDTRFSARPALWQLWKRRLEGEIKILGLARESRAPLTFEHDGQQLSWERNAEPSFEIGRSRKAELPSESFELRLQSRAFDLIELENRSQDPVDILWHEERPLELPGHGVMSLQGSQLQGLRTLDESSRIIVQSSQREAPREFELLTVRARSAAASARDALFGFEQPAARIHQ
ncbi:MAG: hypothetical protein RBU37_13355, partial [Myxococcota bacterium]|nr:hypothetical protein [Myxococcota bacterium]